ncbi:MAG: glycosyltransferase family 4 protein [Candidatus Lokiarchaeota archaeon]|nr:glycosyltransferase family 4 protein [Candidatus Lokiarchaeota archaeon]
MRIGIDARVLEKRMTGIGRFLCDLLESIPSHDSKNEYYLFSCSELTYYNGFYNKIVTGKSILPSKVYSPFWLNFVLPKLLKRHKIDIYFTPNYLIPIRKMKGTKFIIVVSDMAHMVSDNFHSSLYNLYLKTLLPISINNSDEIITISESSKQDIIKYYNVDADRITVVYISANNIFTDIDFDEEKAHLVKNKFKLPLKFILYVGVIENRKNIFGLFRVIDLLRKDGRDIHLVLIGKPGFGFQKIKKEIDGRHNYLHYLNFIDDESLSIIYKLADIFIFPSYYEGFGLPPLEAMQVGLPVVSSNSSSLKEVVGSGGIMCDPDDHESFVKSISRLLDDSNYHDEMKEKALIQAKKFNRNVEIKKMIEIFNKFSDEK